MLNTDHKNKKIWFPAKQYGWGWSFPCCWQGWASLLGYISGISIWSVAFNPVDSTVTFIAGILTLTMSFVAICYLKGEAPKWRWGNEPSNAAGKDDSEGTP